MAPSFTCDETPALAVFNFPSLGTCPTDPAAHLLPSRWPQTPTPRVRDQKRPWHARSENTAYFSISLWSRLSKTFLLLYSSDQRLLLFLLLLLILFCSLITQSSLTMTLMLMRRWRGCFNELHSTSEELRRVRESEWVALNIKTHLVLQLARFTGRDLSAKGWWESGTRKFWIAR